MDPNHHNNNDDNNYQRPPDPQLPPIIARPLAWLSRHAQELSQRVGLIWTFILGAVFLLLGWMLLWDSTIGILLAIPALAFGGMLIHRGLI